MLLHNGDQEIYVWAVHAGGTTPETEDQPTAPSPDAPIEELPAEGDGGGDEFLVAIDTEPVDFTAMTKAEIIELCSCEYGVLLEASLTKSALISEAEALATAAPLPDALMDDLMP